MQLVILGTDNGDFIICGITGVAGASSKQNDNILNTLLILDAIRGIDSTGVAAISANNDVSVAKAVGNPYELIGTRAYDKTVGGINRAIIGHNRWATQGAVNKRNAHPFEFDNLVGVHNGTLSNKWELEDQKSFIVDSENLYHHMEKKGLHNLLGVMKGAWSLVWWNKAEETLNFLRNKERPMHICWADDFKSMYWASEAWMLDVAVSRYGVKRTEIVETEEDMLYSYHIDDKSIIYEPAKLASPSRATIFTPPATSIAGSPAKEVGGAVVPIKKPHIGMKTVTTEIGGYAGKKTVALEILASCIDRFGAKYLSCFDEEEPTTSVRLYVHRSDVITYEEGAIIVADIANFKYEETHKGSTSKSEYYRVLPTTVVLFDDMYDEMEPNPNVYYPDHKGKKKLLSDWNNDHGTCAVCTGYVNPAQNFRFTTDGSSICHECVAQPETALMVSYQKP